ncbi:MAG: hypothetical protein MZW92_39435 [Comamonadaceae bacterium]|nr:hypothetical protein [Comamonadaceae bacterium]
MGYGPGGGNCMGPGRMGGMGPRGMADVATVDASLAALKIPTRPRSPSGRRRQAYAGSRAGTRRAHAGPAPGTALRQPERRPITFACRDATWQQRQRSGPPWRMPPTPCAASSRPEQNGIFGNWPGPMAGRGMRGPRW